MKDQKSGARHILLYYRRSMDRIWKATLVLGIIISAAGWWALVNQTFFFGISSDVWLFISAVIAFGLSAFAFIARYMAYVQAHSSYLSIVMPFLRFRVSYRRIRSVHPVLFQQLFPMENLNWSQRSFLEAFYGKTVLVLELFGYPLNPNLLKLFLPAQMFSPRSTGLVILVADWMKLSTELDSLQSIWLQSQKKSMKVNK